MKNEYPKLVKVGNADMLAFLDTDGHVQMIATDRLDGVNRHKSRPGASVLLVEREEGGQMMIPSIHKPIDFINLGVGAKK